MLEWRCTPEGVQEGVNDEWWWLLYNTETLYAALRCARCAHRDTSARRLLCFLRGILIYFRSLSAFLNALAPKIYILDPYSKANISGVVSVTLHNIRVAS